MIEVLKSYFKKIIPNKILIIIEESDTVRKLTSGSLWGIIGAITSRLSVLVGMIFVARMLGKVSYGEFGVIQSTVISAGLLAGLGLSGTATRFIAQYISNDKKSAGEIIGLVRKITWITIIFTAVLLAFSSKFIAKTLLNAPNLSNILMLSTILVAANVLRGVQSGIFSGLERFDLIAKLNIFEGMLVMLLMIIFTHLFGLLGAVLGMAMGSITPWLYGQRLLDMIFKEMGVIVSYDNSKAHWGVIRNYSIPSLLAHLVAIPVLWVAISLLARTQNGYAEMGSYNAAYQWHGPLIFFPIIIMSSSIPTLVRAWEQGNINQFRKIALWLCILTLALSAPPAILLSVFSELIISLYGKDYEGGSIVLVILLAAAPFHALSKITSAAIQGMNKAWWLFYLNSLWGGVLVLLTYLLVTDWGARGLALSFLLAYVSLAIASAIAMLIGSRLKH